MRSKWWFSISLSHPFHLPAKNHPTVFEFSHQNENHLLGLFQMIIGSGPLPYIARHIVDPLRGTAAIEDTHCRYFADLALFCIRATLFPWTPWYSLPLTALCGDFPLPVAWKLVIILAVFRNGKPLTKGCGLYEQTPTTGALGLFHLRMSQYRGCRTVVFLAIFDLGRPQLNIFVPTVLDKFSKPGIYHGIFANFESLTRN